jgi:hypothetical protein
VGTGFPQKMRQNQKPRSLSDSIEPESDLGRELMHDPEKACPGRDPGWVPVFGKRSCTNKRLERDGDSKKVITL